jgi:LmbE family N-acetylglucosaminyl deacetylase
MFFSRCPHVLILGLLFGVAASFDAPAQLRPQPVAELPGSVALELMLRKLSSTGTFMETTAHPDDENNALLAMLGHGEGMRTVLVSATRGDGGQNEIGPELSEALGVLRTEELLTVHRFDGAEQYFTRAVDFGFSFSIEETLERWGHEEILGDFVRHIRTTRPDVIVGFLCSGEVGGQHHQAAARLTTEAFTAAADPSRFPEQLQEGLRPWQAARVFCTDISGFGPPRPAVQSTPDQVVVSTSRFDSVLGRTFAEIGTEARSMHKCQGMSQLLLLPGQTQNRTYRLTGSAVDDDGVAPPALFDGIDTSLTGLVRFAPSMDRELWPTLHELSADVGRARGALGSSGAAAATPHLAAGLERVRALRSRVAGMEAPASEQYEADVRLALKESQFAEALRLAAGVRLDALAADGLVVPGQAVAVNLYAGGHAGEPIVVRGMSVSGGTGDAGECSGEPESGRAVTCTATLQVPRETPLSSPYWTPRQDAARYDFAPGVPFGVPFAHTPFAASFELTVAGVDMTVARPVEFRYEHIVSGEKRMELQVVPPIAVTVAPEIAVMPVGAAPVTTVEVRATNHLPEGVAGVVTLRLPDGWASDPASAPVSFAREDEQVTVAFEVRPPAGITPSAHVVTALVRTGAAGALESTSGFAVIEYPHIRRRHLVQPAQTRIKVIDVKIAPRLRVGYIMGVGDQVPAAIEQLGAELRLISPQELASGDLSQYDAIVTGVRAYERRPDLRASNHRLLRYAEGGGTVLVQYNKFEFNEAQYGPFPAKVGTSRVTDETAPIELLVPDHPVFNVPNRIDAAAWEGWVQERGLYFLGERDSRYVDLLRSADPFPFNPGPRTGALVEARVGDGRWIYIGLGLWRQLPAGTEGAYKLMANLLSLGRAR